MNAATRYTWLRWVLVALVLLVGIGLLVVLTGSSTPLVRTDEGNLFR